MLFVTTAAYGEDEYPTWLEHYRKQLRGYGIEAIEELDVRGKTDEDLQKVDTDIIFVNGGNTFYLLHWVRESGFDRIIKEFVEEGKLYVGVSAGSYIVCPTIEAAGWRGADKNIVHLTDLTALTLVPFLISAHYVESYRPTLEKAACSTFYPIVVLNDKQAILVTDKETKVVGNGERIFLNGFEEK